MRQWRRVGIRLLPVLVLAAACGDGDRSGPGTLEVRVVPPPSVEAGAAVVEFVGEGIQGFEAAGGARVFGGPVQGQAGRHRAVVVVDQGELVFRVRMDDVARVPEASLVEAADLQNRSIPALSAFQLRISR